MEIKSIFKIEAIFIDDDVVVDFDYILSTKSIEEIKEHVLFNYIEYLNRELGDDNTLHHINVIELPLNQILEDGDFLSYYTFLPDGSLYLSKEYYSIQNRCNFEGRNEEELPLKIGDKVYCIVDNNIKYGIIYDLPPKPGTFQYLDAYDDCYLILEGYDSIPSKLTDDEYITSHIHVDVNNVFKRN